MTLRRILKAMFTPTIRIEDSRNEQMKELLERLEKLEGKKGQNARSQVYPPEIKRR